MALIAGGVLVGAGLIILAVMAFSGKGREDRAEEPVAAQPKPAARPAPRAALPAGPVIEPRQAEPEKPPAERESRPEPLPKPAAGENGVPLPTPRLSNPLDGAIFRASMDVPLEAEARDPEGRIARAEFWQGSVKLGESTDVPYRFTWKGVRPAGTYTLRVKTIEKSGAERESAAVRITIEPDLEAAEAAAAAPAEKPPAEEAAKEKPTAREESPKTKRDPAPPVDQKKVDLAIKKGVQYLVGQVGKMGTAFAKEPSRECQQDALVLWTFAHTDVSESSTVFRYLFKTVTEAEIRRTYEASLQAMILEELDRVRYQGRIIQCAQFLLDNQCPNGQWSYGEPVAPSRDVPTSLLGPLPVPTASRPSGGPSGKERQKPLVTRKLKLQPRRTGPAEGDNSNSQYAALGIRACSDAGIAFPDDTLERARKWFKGSQHAAEGAAGSGGVATGPEPSAPAAGWCYDSKYKGHGAYGSMTAGAVGAIAIYDTLLGEDWRKDPAVASGLSWLAKHFSVSGNPGPPSEEWAKGDTHWCHFYYLYALERAGVLCRTDWMGRHAWYAEGANVLIGSQGRDGAWNESPTDTCFALLFLRRATRPLEDVASMDERSRK
jgi:hypothetical protein